jgi:hypothetical protein
MAAGPPIDRTRSQAMLDQYVAAQEDTDKPRTILEFPGSRVPGGMLYSAMATTDPDGTIRAMTQEEIEAHYLEEYGRPFPTAEERMREVRKGLPERPPPPSLVKLLWRDAKAAWDAAKDRWHPGHRD